MGGSPLQRKSVAGGVNVKLRRALKKEIGRLSQLFAPWDADGSGSIDELEFRRAIRMLGLRTDPRDFQEFAKLCKAADGGISLDALIALVEAEDFDFDPEEEAQKSFKEPTPAKKRNLCVRAAGALGGLVNTVSAQTLLYFSFVILFQLLTDTLRLREEYLLDKFVSDTFFDNHFDATLNQFAHIRRTADVFEWGNQVLWPWAARQLLEHAPHAACACAPSCVWHVHRRCCGRGCSATPGRAAARSGRPATFDRRRRGRRRAPAATPPSARASRVPATTTCGPMARAPSPGRGGAPSRCARPVYPQRRPRSARPACTDPRCTAQQPLTAALRAVRVLLPLLLLHAGGRGRLSHERARLDGGARDRAGMRTACSNMHALCMHARVHPADPCSTGRRGSRSGRRAYRRWASPSAHARRTPSAAAASRSSGPSTFTCRARTQSHTQRTAPSALSAQRTAEVLALRVRQARRATGTTGRTPAPRSRTRSCTIRPRRRGRSPTAPSRPTPPRCASTRPAASSRTCTPCTYTRVHPHVRGMCTACMHAGTRRAASSPSSSPSSRRRCCPTRRARRTRSPTSGGTASRASRRPPRPGCRATLSRSSMHHGMHPVHVYTCASPSCAWRVHAHAHGMCTACTQAPRYFCVRLVWNGDFIHQLCDPNDAAGRTTGRVRAAVEELWNDLLKARPPHLTDCLLIAS